MSTPAGFSILVASPPPDRRQKVAPPAPVGFFTDLFRVCPLDRRSDLEPSLNAQRSSRLGHPPTPPCWTHPAALPWHESTRRGHRAAQAPLRLYRVGALRAQASARPSASGQLPTPCGSSLPPWAWQPAGSASVRCPRVGWRVGLHNGPRAKGATPAAWRSLQCCAPLESRWATGLRGAIARKVL